MQESFNFILEEKQQPIEDFVVSPANRYAYSLITNWPENWNSNAVLIYGPSGSGKTTLAEIWKKKTAATFIKPDDIYSGKLSGKKNYIIDDIEKVHDEVALFHFFNLVKERKGYILFTSCKHPQNLNIRLPDLKSRINAIPSAGLDNPDDELIRTLLLKNFVEHQLKVGMDVIDYMVMRIDRSFSVINNIVDILDRESLKEKKNITVPFVKNVLESNKLCVE